MAVKVEKSFQVKQPIERVWNLLSNPRRVASLLPGAQVTGQIDDSNYEGSIRVKVGPTVTDFKGEVQLVRVDNDAHEIEILGKGKDIKGKGSASMKMRGKLNSLDGGGTEVTSVSELNIAGIFAQMGGRVIQEVSNIMFNKFVENFREKLEQESAQGGAAHHPESTPQPLNAVSLAFSALKAAVVRPSESKTESEAQDKPGEKH